MGKFHVSSGLHGQHLKLPVGLGSPGSSFGTLVCSFDFILAFTASRQFNLSKWSKGCIDKSSIDKDLWMAS